MNWAARIVRARLLEEAEFIEWRRCRTPSFHARVLLGVLACGLRDAARQLERA